MMNFSKPRTMNGGLSAVQTANRRGMVIPNATSGAKAMKNIANPIEAANAQGSNPIATALATPPQGATRATSATPATPAMAPATPAVAPASPQAAPAMTATSGQAERMAYADMMMNRGQPAPAAAPAIPASAPAMPAMPATPAVPALNAAQPAAPAVPAAPAPAVAAPAMPPDVQAQYDAMIAEQVARGVPLARATYAAQMMNRGRG